MIKKWHPLIEPCFSILASRLKAQGARKEKFAKFEISNSTLPYALNLYASFSLDKNLKVNDHYVIILTF
jgi:hypothetical protein